MGIRQLLRNRFIARFVTIYSGFALVLVGYGLYEPEVNIEEPSRADFVFEGIIEEDDRISSRKYLGRHVLVYFFASW